MFIAAIVIFLAICLIVGPIMMVMPSKSQTRTAKLRAAAMDLGFRVRLTKLSSKTASDIHAVYSLAWPDSFGLDKRQNTNWKILDTGMEHDIHFFGRWEWQNDKAPRWSHTIVNELLKTKPRGVSEISANGAGIECTWDEKKGVESDEKTLQELFNWLNSGREQYVRLCK